jgi:small subunit ribosomal protein S6
MRKYEIMYILNSSLEEEARQELMETLHNIIVNDGGTVDKVDDWGMKEFAYRIEDMTKGYYVVINVTAEPDAIKEFDRICRINANVVRTMIVNLDNQ